jgi:hypothetical protein
MHCLGPSSGKSPPSRTGPSGAEQQDSNNVSVNATCQKHGRLTWLMGGTTAAICNQIVYRWPAATARCRRRPGRAADPAVRVGPGCSAVGGAGAGQLRYGGVAALVERPYARQDARLAQGSAGFLDDVCLGVQRLGRKGTAGFADSRRPAPACAGTASGSPSEHALEADGTCRSFRPPSPKTGTSCSARSGEMYYESTLKETHGDDRLRTSSSRPRKADGHNMAPMRLTEHASN